MQKKLEATILFVDFTKALTPFTEEIWSKFYSPTANPPPNKNVAAIVMLYRNTKVKVRSPDGDTDYFDIVAGVQQGDTLAPYLFIIRLDYVIRISIDKIKKNGFKLTKERSGRYPAKTITDTDYADDIELLANAPSQAETLLHSLKWAATGIDLHFNTYKTEYMFFNQIGDISRLNGSPLKQVHLPRKQCLITRDRHQHATSKGKGIDSYR